MKKLSFLFLLICFLVVGCFQEQRPSDLLDEIKLKDRINVGIKTDSRPFGFLRNGEITGFDADIAYEISKKIFMSDFRGHVKFIPLKPSERISALNTGKVDIVIATLSVNERRKDIIDFSRPYFVAGQAIMVPRYSRISSISQLNNKPVAIVLGTTGEKTLRLLAPNANAVGTLTYKEAFELLKQNKVDAILADDSLLYGLLLETRGYKILPARYTEEYYAVGIKKGEDTKNLRKMVNLTIKSLEQSGKLNKIKNKWIPHFKMK